VGTPGQKLIIIGVYGFKYAAWLPVITPWGDQSYFLFFYSRFRFFFLLSLVLLIGFEFNRTLS
jgi:hypothetical protein